MGVNSLPKTVARQCRDCDLNPGPSAPESSTLTTRLPSQHWMIGLKSRQPSTKIRSIVWFVTVAWSCAVNSKAIVNQVADAIAVCRKLRPVVDRWRLAHWWIRLSENTRERTTADRSPCVVKLHVTSVSSAMEWIAGAETRQSSK